MLCRRCTHTTGCRNLKRHRLENMRLQSPCEQCPCDKKLPELMYQARATGKYTDYPAPTNTGKPAPAKAQSRHTSKHYSETARASAIANMLATTKALMNMQATANLYGPGATRSPSRCRRCTQGLTLYVMLNTGMPNRGKKTKKNDKQQETDQAALHQPRRANPQRQRHMPIHSIFENSALKTKTEASSKQRTETGK